MLPRYSNAGYNQCGVATITMVINHDAAKHISSTIRTVVSGPNVCAWYQVIVGKGELRSEDRSRTPSRPFKVVYRQGEET